MGIKETSDNYSKRAVSVSVMNIVSTQQIPNMPQQKNHAKEMEMLRETIFKLANSEPNVPLSQTKNAVLQQHLNRFFDCLYTAPDHPSYTWVSDLFFFFCKRIKLGLIGDYGFNCGNSLLQ